MMYWIVICREDRIGRRKGPYTLATRQVFDDYAIALEYANTINVRRQPLIISGRWTELRLPEATA